MKKNKNLFKIVSVLLLAFVITLSTGLNSVSVSANTPYRTYTNDGYGRTMETQTAYLAQKTLIKFGNEFMSNPSDMYITSDGTIYVADTGHGRILVGTADGKLLNIIGKGKLKTPMGVFVTSDKKIYVADKDGKAVFVFDQNGKVLNKYTKPDSPLYGEGLDFLPQKIVVNDAGVMYIVCQSNTNGIVEISPEEGGTFLGYFGTNYASVSLQNMSLKRLNIAGTNLIKGGVSDYDESPAAVTTGNHDNIYVASSQGYIYEYNKQGELLYVFGGTDDGTQRVGLSTQVTSIQVDSKDNIYVLDSDKKQIQVYEPSEFTQLLHKALYLYSKGHYTESKKPLQQVLQMNSMFDYANKAMGRAYFQEENYDMALKYARLAKDYEGYSDAFWEIRNEWLKDNIVAALVIIVALWAAFKIVKSLDKKKGILAKPKAAIANFKQKTFVANVCYSKYFMKHPIDGSYGIAREGRASWSAPSFILLVFMIEYVINKYLCGFLQKTVREGRYEIFSDIGKIVIVMAAITLCNYLVCTINEGEGTIKKIYTYFCYSLLPYVVYIPFSFILTHILTTNEQFLITLLQYVIYGWVIVLVILGIKEVNNYTAKETAKVICITIFTILIMALLIFIIYVLWAQVFEFISAVFGEVVYRFG